LLRREDPMMRSLTLMPGTLNVFKSKNTPHKVIPVAGARVRVVAVLTFSETPRKRFTDEERIGFTAAHPEL
jgi:hypothetical protein